MGPRAQHLHRVLRSRLRLRLPGQTVRSRLTWLYGGLFLVAGAVLLAILAVLWGSATGDWNIFASKAPAAILHIAGLGPGPVARAGGGFVVSVPPGADSVATSSSPVFDEAAKAATVKRGGVVHQLHVFASQQHSTDLHELLLYSALALAIMAIVSIALGWLTAGRVLRPLRTITGTARRISASNLHERLGLQGAEDELKELGDTFDQLLGRLERSFQSQRQFVANASHELRTPMATMRASLEVALAKPGPIPEQTVMLARRLEEELDQVDRLMESFLALARAQAGPLHDEALALETLVESALRKRAGTIADMGLAVHREGLAEAPVVGDETLITRMVENVIDNAVRHNEPGGWVRLSSGVEGDRAYLVVENSGQMLAEATVADLAVPFRRLGADRTNSDNGFGLGLSIVASIAETHGGHLELHALERGGFQARVELPVSTLALSGAPG